MTGTACLILLVKDGCRHLHNVCVDYINFIHWKESEFDPTPVSESCVPRDTLTLDCNSADPNMCSVRCNTLICLQFGYTWSILIRDSQGRDSFTEDTLLSAWD